jgi:PhnB protein
MQLSVYLFVYGRAEEAMKFYQSILGGELEVQHVGDSPAAADMPKEWHGKVMHSTLHGDGFNIMASDGSPDSHQEKESNISLTIGMSDEPKAREIFAKLSEGGNVTMAMEKMFWGAVFGQVTDKFGFDWMINCTPA